MNKAKIFAGIGIFIIAIGITIVAFMPNNNKSQNYGDVTINNKDGKTATEQTPEKLETENEKIIEPDVEDIERAQTLDLEPVQYIKDDPNEQDYPFIYHEGKKYYMQYGAYLMGSQYRDHHIGTVERQVSKDEDNLQTGDGYKVRKGTEYLNTEISPNLIMSQDFGISAYYLYSTMPLRYTSLNELVKDQDQIMYAGIYTNYYYDQGIPAPDELHTGFLGYLREVPYTFENYTSPVDNATDSLIYFTMRDGLSYSFRAYYDKELKEVHIVDILNKKEYVITDLTYSQSFMTIDEMVEDMGGWERMDGRNAPVEEGIEIEYVDEE